jgi:hypothetical protein
MPVIQGGAKKVKRGNKGEVKRLALCSFPKSLMQANTHKDETENGIGFKPRRSKPTLTNNFWARGLLDN